MSGCLMHNNGRRCFRWWLFPVLCHGKSLDFWYSINQCFSFAIRRAVIINEDIFGVSWRIPEQIENRHSIVGILLGETIVFYPDTAKIRYTCQPGSFCRIRKLVVLHIEILE